MKPLKSSEIKGNWATLLLFTNEDGTIDFGRMDEELDVLISSAPDGIYSNGTSGEFHTQNEVEFEQVNRLLAEKCETAGIPFQIGVSHMSGQLSLERLRRSVELKPAAVQVILPDWFPLTNDEAVCFLEKMAETAGDIGLVLYNPPHAKRVLAPTDWKYLKKWIPSLVGVKVSDQGGDEQWYAEVKKHAENLSVFIPGHNLATGITLGAHGAYSNMACLNPNAAQSWYEQMKKDMSAALELESRIQQFMKQYIAPLITEYRYSNPACDRFMAVMGGWADVGEHMRWPYRSVPKEWADRIKPEAEKLIPEFFDR
jgi:dihydrodipicolinate synthase/N-acetylneuraminate lyase